MTVSTTVTAQRGGWFKFTLTGAASTDNAGLGAIANPEGVLLGVTRVFAYFRTGSTGAANLSAGIGAIDAASSDIVSAMDVIQATVGGKLMHLPAVQVAETENPTAKWTSTTYLNITGSASTVGLDADVYVEYVRLA
jgi:hypothetical protein